MSASNALKEPELVYTLSEAAEIMRMTKRAIAKVGKRHGLCMVNGRHIAFTASQLAEIQDVLRPHVPVESVAPNLRRIALERKAARRAARAT